METQNRRREQVSPEWARTILQSRSDRSWLGVIGARNSDLGVIGAANSDLGVIAAGNSDLGIDRGRQE